MGKPNTLRGRALVLGGGGVAGIAWMTGLLLGLSDEGVDLHGVTDTLIGTSAGSTVAAQIAGDTRLDDLFQRQVDPARQVAELQPKPHLLELVSHALPVLFELSDPTERTRRIGDLAVNTTTVPESVRRNVIAARLPEHKWPDRVLKIVAVDITTGEPRVFDRLSGVELVDAVAASCAVPGLWPPVSIGDRHYMDGGIRSSDNADLAAGSETIVVISPLGTGGVTLPGSSNLSSQVEVLHRDGARTRVIEPDDAARKAIGQNPLSPDTRIPAAEAGRAQGRAIAAGLAMFSDKPS
ncbi:patatin-like phospholipase family protein [Lichenihabitans sp. Uapishka_5]|uniref:patatin-like phospholipase family protein n=1 Tax=Lichenihabitans sp. Uapishka_5 TaxID=3037302 RepID=UPI0029E8151D|nr:patatin-like phospholipase family protein [Lichenihabitans sp. Uapishka_5]MDX7952353.1 patatin-like phospholipase family protein [Lichenihabitans sp. Uapishka_5]